MRPAARSSERAHRRFRASATRISRAPVGSCKRRRSCGSATPVGKRSRAHPFSRCGHQTVFVFAALVLHCTGSPQPAALHGSWHAERWPARINHNLVRCAHARKIRGRAPGVHTGNAARARPVWRSALSRPHKNRPSNRNRNRSARAEGRRHAARGDAHSGLCVLRPWSAAAAGAPGAAHVRRGRPCAAPRERGAGRPGAPRAISLAAPAERREAREPARPLSAEREARRGEARRSGNAPQGTPLAAWSRERKLGARAGWLVRDARRSRVAAAPHVLRRG